MKKLAAGLTALVLATSCIDRHANYSNYLESYPHHVVSEEGIKEALAGKAMKENLQDLELYFFEVNFKKKAFELAEFKRMIKGYNAYLGAISGEKFDVNHIIVTSSEELLVPPITGLYFFESAVIVLKENKLSMPIFTHEYGHHTDKHRSLNCKDHTLVDACKKEDKWLAIRSEAVAKAFEFYTAEKMGKTYPRYVEYLGLTSAPSGELGKASSMEDFLEKVPYDFSSERYAAAATVFAIVNAHYATSFEETWKRMRSMKPDSLFAILERISKSHPWERVVNKSFHHLWIRSLKL